MSDLLQTAKDEYRKNAWFQLATIGGALILAASIINVAHNFLTRRDVSAGLVIASIGALALNAAYVALIMYSNYCIVNGQCNVLAELQGIFAVVLGVIAFILAIGPILMGKPSRSGRK